MWRGAYFCGAIKDGGDGMVGSRVIRHRSFEDFSYGKQSLDGLLFLQRAFFVFGGVVAAGWSMWLLEEPVRGRLTELAACGRTGLRVMTERVCGLWPNDLTAYDRQTSRRLIFRIVSLGFYDNFFLSSHPRFKDMPGRRILGRLTGEIAQLVRAQDS